MRQYIILIICFVSLATPGFPQTTVFHDDFENGVSQWILTGTWGLSTEFSNSPSHSLADSPDSNYTGGTTSYATLANGVDLSGYLSATLAFSAVYSLENEFDFVYVQVSDDNFNTFTTLGQITGENILTSSMVWNQFSYSLGAYLHGNVKIRFMFFSDNYVNFEGFYADDISIVGSYDDTQPPEVSYSPPPFYEGNLGPFQVVAGVIDVSGISSTFLNYRVDGILQSQTITGINQDSNIYLYSIPALPAGSWVDYWISAIDNSSGQNIAVTDTFSYIAGNYIKYDDGIADYYTITGPESNYPQYTAWAVRFTIPEMAPNPVTALIRNYTDYLNPNNQMLVHVWEADSAGGIGNDLITPFLVWPEANLNNVDAMTRIDLRPYTSQLINHSGDLFIGYTVPNGVVNILLGSPAEANRSYFRDGLTWSPKNSDYFFRAITGSNQLDAGAAAILSPVSGFNLGSQEHITLRVKNYGTDVLTSIPVAYVINGSSPVIDTITCNLAHGDSITFVFPVTADLSAFGTYTIDAYSMLSGDQNTGNDHCSVTIIHDQQMYCDTLHYDGPNHTGIGLTNGGTFKVAVRYPSSMVYPLTGGHIKKVQLYLKEWPSSCILKIWDAGTSTSPGNEIYSQDVTNEVWGGWQTFTLNTPVEIAGTDCWVGYQLTHEAGQHPAGIDAGPGDPNGYWIYLGSGPWSTTIGNWNIRSIICRPAESIDVGATGIVSPTSSPVLGSNEPLTIKVKNFGTQAQSMIPVAFSMNGGIAVTDTIPDTLEPGIERSFTFQQVLNLADTGAYNFDVYTQLPDDQNQFNNHFATIITHIAFIECDTLHFDGDHQANMGLSNGGPFKIAVHFPASIVNPVVSGTVEKLQFYIGELPTSYVLKIWSEGTATGPGNELLSLDVTNQLIPFSWNFVTLNTPVIVETTGFWAGCAVNHASGKHPVGCDQGTANINGNWISVGTGGWMHNPGYTNLGNWNFRAIVCPTAIANATLEGNVSYANLSHTKLNNVTVLLKSGDVIIKQAVTDNLGHFIITDFPLGDYQITAEWNHQWGGSNAVDALAVLRHFVGLTTLEGIYFQAADVNADGNVNSMDALSIARRFVGLITGFPNGDWVFENKNVTISGPGNYSQDLNGLCNGDVDGSYVPE